MKMVPTKAAAFVLLGLFFTTRSLLAQGPSDGSQDVDSYDDVWIKDCMGREVPAALLENSFCDSFSLKHLVSYKSHDSSEANNEAHALGINLDCTKLAFDGGACSASDGEMPGQPKEDVELIIIQPTRDTFQIYLKSLRTIHGFDISFSALYQPELLSGTSEVPSSSWLASQPELSLSTISKGSAILLGPHTEKTDPELETSSGTADWFVSRQFETTTASEGHAEDLFISPSSEMHLFMEMRLTANIDINFTSFEGTEIQEIEGSVELLGSVLSICVDDMTFFDSNGKPMVLNMISPNCWNPNQLNGHGSKLVENYPDVTYFLFDYGDGDLYSAALPLVESLSLGLTRCPEDLTRDCRGICTPKKWLHDKVCHENFNCMELGYDGGDCLASNTGSTPAAATTKFHIETYEVSNVYKTAIYAQANEPFAGFSFRLVDEQGSADAFSISKVYLSKGLISAAGMTTTWDENQNIVSAFMKSALQHAGGETSDEVGALNMTALHTSCTGETKGKPNMCLVMEIVLSTANGMDSPSAPEGNSNSSDFGASLVSDSFTGTTSIANQRRTRPRRVCLESVQVFGLKGDPISSSVHCSVSERDGVLVTPILSTGIGGPSNPSVSEVPKSSTSEKDIAVWEQGLHHYENGHGALHTTIEVLFDTDHIVQEIDFDFEYVAFVGDDVETVPANVALMQNHGSSSLVFVLMDTSSHVRARPKSADGLVMTPIDVPTTNTESTVHATLSGTPLFSKPLKPQVKFHILASESILPGTNIQLCIRQAQIVGVWNKEISVVQPRECIDLGEQPILKSSPVIKSPAQPPPKLPTDISPGSESEISIFVESASTFYAENGRELYLVHVYAMGDSQDIRGLEFNIDFQGRLVYGMGWNASYTPGNENSAEFFELAVHSGNIAIAHNAPVYAPMLTCLNCPENLATFGAMMEEEKISHETSPLGMELVSFLKSHDFPLFIWPASVSLDSAPHPAQLLTSFLFEFNQTSSEDNVHPEVPLCISQANFLSKASIPFTTNYQTSSLCTTVLLSSPSGASSSDSSSSSASLSLPLILGIIAGIVLLAAVVLFIVYRRSGSGSADSQARIAPLGMIISPGRASNLPKRKNSMLIGEAANHVAPADGVLDANSTGRSRCISTTIKPRTYAPRIRLDV